MSIGAAPVVNLPRHSENYQLPREHNSSSKTQHAVQHSQRTNQNRQVPTTVPPVTSNYQHLALKLQNLPRNLMQFHEGEVACEA